MHKITVSHDKNIDRWTVVRSPLEGERDPSTLSLHVDREDSLRRGRLEAARLHEETGGKVELVVKGLDGKVTKSGRTYGGTPKPAKRTKPKK